MSALCYFPPMLRFEIISNKGLLGMLGIMESIRVSNKSICEIAIDLDAKYQTMSVMEESHDFR